VLKYICVLEAGVLPEDLFLYVFETQGQTGECPRTEWQTLNRYIHIDIYIYIYIYNQSTYMYIQAYMP